MRSGTYTKAAAGCAAGLLLVAGCGTQEDGSGDTPTVVTGVYPLEWLAEEVGGDRTEVVQLTDPGAEPHHLELSPKQLGQISEADLTFYISGLQPAVDDAVQQESGERALDTAELVDLRPADPEAGHDEGHEDGDGHGEEHDHGETDPHMWLDPTLMSQAAEGLADRMAEVDPEGSDGYQDRAAAVTDELEAIDTEYEEGLDQCESRSMVTNHTAFSYLADRYDLDQVGVSGIDAESEPSPARMAEVSELIEEHDVTTIFTETLSSPKAAETIAEETGTTTEVLDPLGGITEDSPGDDYPSVMRANLETLESALRCS
ncbi:zinc transport system substrate-binding protein [Haloactinospora alba]|uniref:Zinc transport system substrate-binding protein n=1 Tax=Haloactinospora alba TaxID=405555 RepID=A0A543NGG0_9ACTN|nr:metal ABC transporter substrate-binding protein [Haloactinospora alba]TQN30891.1 zinc transport system substrate-binding protein [Haloactinospora alba]